MNGQRGRAQLRSEAHLIRFLSNINSVWSLDRASNGHLLIKSIYPDQMFLSYRFLVSCKLGIQRCSVLPRNLVICQIFTRFQVVPVYLVNLGFACRGARLRTSSTMVRESGSNAYENFVEKSAKYTFEPKRNELARGLARGQLRPCLHACLLIRF